MHSDVRGVAVWDRERWADLHAGEVGWDAVQWMLGVRVHVSVHAVPVHCVRVPSGVDGRRSVHCDVRCTVVRDSDGDEGVFGRVVEWEWVRRVRRVRVWERVHADGVRCDGVSGWERGRDGVFGDVRPAGPARAVRASDWERHVRNWELGRIVRGVRAVPVHDRLRPREPVYLRCELRGRCCRRDCVHGDVQHGARVHDAGGDGECDVRARYVERRAVWWMWGDAVPSVPEPRPRVRCDELRSWDTERDIVRRVVLGAELLRADCGVSDVRPRDVHGAGVQRVQRVPMPERVHAAWVRCDGLPCRERARDGVQRDVRWLSVRYPDRPSDVPVWIVDGDVHWVRAVRVHGAVHAGELRCERMLRASGVGDDVHGDVRRAVVLRHCGWECDVFGRIVHWRVHGVRGVPMRERVHAVAAVSDQRVRRWDCARRDVHCNVQHRVLPAATERCYWGHAV